MNATKAEVLRHFPQARRARSRVPALNESGNYVGFPHEIRIQGWNNVAQRSETIVIGKGMTSSAAWDAALAHCLASTLIS